MPKSRVAGLRAARRRALLRRAAGGCILGVAAFAVSFGAQASVAAEVEGTAAVPRAAIEIDQRISRIRSVLAADRGAEWSGDPRRSPFLLAEKSTDKETWNNWDNWLNK